MGRFSRAWTALTGRQTLTAEKMRGLVKAAYYGAAADTHSMDFSFASDAGINAALLADLQKLRTRCRYELKQNGLAKGMGRVYANSVVGTGPRLKIICEDSAWASRAERVFSSWARTADLMDGGSLGMQIHCGVRQFFPCGEYFLIQRPAASGAVRLRYLMIRPDRIRDPYQSTTAKIDNGVEVDADGLPVAYWIQTDDPDNGALVASVQKFARVPAERVVHVFFREDPIQHRGEPWLAVSLPNFHKLRRYDEAQIAAAIVAAKFAAVLINTNPDVVSDAGQILPADVMEIQDGMMLVPPPGYEPRQIDPKQPNANSSDFRRDQLAAAGAGNAMPANIVTQDSSRSNFASARFDGVTLAQDGEVVRQIIEDRHLNRVLDSVLAEALAAGAVPALAPGLDFLPVWLWTEENRHSDPLKQSNANKVRAETGLATVGQINMEEGFDGETTFAALVQEVNRWRAAGLKHPLDAKAERSAGGGAPAPAPDEEGG
jgi:lambda family phage portal protein